MTEDENHVCGHKRYENIDAKDAERIFVEFTSTKMTFVFHVIEEEEMQGNTDG